MSRSVSLLLRFSLVVVLGSTTLGLLAWQVAPRVADLGEAASFESASNIVLPELLEGSTILDMNGEPIGELVGAENREVVSLDQMSDELVATVIAVEDADFYVHDGVSARSILRALRANSASGEVTQGGSTITQQLVKLSLVGDDQTLGRKVREASLAIQLENQFCEEVPKEECKDRILEQYLNLVYLGRGVYGMEAAARMYFGIPASEVGWEEAAMLTALIRNPTGYDPIRFPEVAAERREIVTGRLVDEGLIDAAEAERINSAPLPEEPATTAAAASAQDLSYFERKVRDELLEAEWLAPTEELRRYLIFNGGLTITSTMDPRAQLLASFAAAQNPVKEANPEAVAAVVSVEPSTGAVRAVVGETTIPGRGVVEVATPSVGRSPGSSFKVFTLLAALEEGYGVNASISAAPAPSALYDDWDLPSSVRTWPSGCSRSRGSLTLLRATAGSNNCAFARLQAAVGGEEVVDVAQRLGISTVPDAAARYPSLTLGGVSVQPLEMAAAYAAIANEGRYNPPHFVTRVEDRDGNVLYEYEPPNEQVIEVDVARQATVALQAVVSGGTYNGGDLPDDRPAAGKTGTNEAEGGENTDVWFVGYTPQMATAVWIGNPAGATELRGGRVQGGSTAAVVWREFMAPYLEGAPVVEFPEPDQVGSSRYIRDPWQDVRRSSSRSSSSSSSSSRRSTTEEDSDVDPDPDSEDVSVPTAPPTTAAPTTAAPVPPPPGPDDGGGGGDTGGGGSESAGGGAGAGGEGP